MVASVQGGATTTPTRGGGAGQPLQKGAAAALGAATPPMTDGNVGLSGLAPTAFPPLPGGAPGVGRPGGKGPGSAAVVGGVGGRARRRWRQGPRRPGLRKVLSGRSPRLASALR